MSLSASQTLSQLKQAMKTKGDFPSVSSTLEGILHSMKDNESSDEKMTALVLSDFAMTQKVLRLANSTMYAAFGPVTTVSMALYVLGTETVGHLAMGLKLIDNLGQAAETQVAKQELSKAVVAGAIARNIGLTRSGKDGEPLAVATLIRSLGKLLVCFYLPDQFAVIEAENPATFEEESTVAAKVLGLPYNELALNVADDWNLPPELKASAATPVASADARAHWRHAVTGYAMQYVTVVSEGGGQEELEALADQHTAAIGLPSSELLTQAQSAVNTALEEANGETPPFMVTEDRKRASNRKADNGQNPQLAKCLSDIEALQPGMRLGQVLKMATDALCAGLGGTKVMLFLLNRQAASFELVMGHGDGVTENLRKIRFPSAFTPDVVHVSLAKGTPIYLNDAFEPNIAKSIPSWLHDVVSPARHILLMPFIINKQPVGIIYLDWSSTRGELSPTEASLIERLHTQVNKALTQALIKP